MQTVTKPNADFSPTLDPSHKAPQPADTSITGADFATEVRGDRLNLIWRVVLGTAVVILVAFLIFNIRFGGMALVAASPLIIGSLVTGRMLQRNFFRAAVWTLSGSYFATASILMLTGNPSAIDLIPFTFPVIIFMVGLLLPPLHTFIAVAIAVVLTFWAPFQGTENIAFLSLHQFAATAIAIVSALLAAQVTGELYQITDWAMENYQRQRHTAMDLFDNRRKLEKALRRSEVLGDTLKDINMELETAKHFRGQFLANMSHELRTPLNAIIGFSETMLSYPMMYNNVALPEAYQRDLQQIHNSGRQLLTVINDILDLSKVDAGKLEIQIERVQLDPLIDNVLMTAAGLVGQKPIEFKRNLPRTLPDVVADESRLRQVLLNLYSNAVKFTDEGQITISMVDQGDSVCLSVTDTGAGIRDDAIGHIFEEFSQVESAGRDPRTGAGLGLTISRKLLSLMGGSISVESLYGEGSTFHVVVPKYQPDEA